MKIKPDKRISKLVRTHNRLTMQISGTIPLMVKKTSCAMVLHFTSKNYSDVETFDDFVSKLESALTEMCKSNDWELDGFFLLNLKKE